MKQESRRGMGARLSLGLVVTCIMQVGVLHDTFAAAPNVYLRSASAAPWGSTANETAMTRVFGSGNWQDLRYETVNPAAVFSAASTFVYMEGSDSTALEMQSFLAANLTLIQAWVAGGGRLFLNAAPNEGTGMDLGFGVTLVYPDTTDVAGASKLTHPVFAGPFAPVGTTWTGSSFAHATVSGTDLISVITNATSRHIVLGEKQFGSGLVLFGGMTTDNFHSPQPQASNLRANIISYVATFVSCSNCAPQIIGQPVSRTTAVGGTAAFDVAVVGTAPLSFQWRHDGLNIPNATNASFTIVNVQSNHVGSYTVVVTNAFGSDTSTEAMLSVLPPSAFVAVFDDPFFVDTGGTADSESDTVQTTLQVLGFPVIPVTDLSAAVNTYRSIVIPEQELNPLAPSLSPDTQAAVSNFVFFGGKLIVHGTTGGRAASLLNSIFGFSLEEIGSSGLPHNLSIEAAASAFADDPPTILDNSFTTLLLRSSLPPGAFNVYTNAAGSSVVVFEQGSGLIIFLGWDWSNAKPLGAVNGGWLNVMESAAAQGVLPPRPPVISAQPSGGTAFIGGTPTFSVGVFGTAPFSFQWRKGTTNISDGTNSSYSIPDVQLANAGNYSVVITNFYGAVTSAVAVLAVTNDPGFFDDFDPGIDLFQWASFSSMVLATNYGGQVSGANSLWFGGDDFSRFAESRSLDTHLGGVVDFYLRLSSGVSEPWEQVDVPGEGVVLEYSIDSGASWIGIGVYDTSIYTNWTHIVADLPPAAQTFATRVRWRQLSNSGGCCDHWALDNVSVVTGPRAPSILQQPQNRATVSGSPVTFTVLAGGSTPLGFQWRKDGTNVANATNSVFTIGSVQENDVGFYSVFVTNLYGTALSDDASLTVVSSNAAVAVFDDPVFVDSGGGVAAESDNLQATIQSFGYVALPVTNLVAAATAFRRIVIPEQENSELAPALTPATRAALSNFVFNGGKLVVHGTSSGSGGTLINSILGLSVSETGTGEISLTRGADAIGTDFAGNPPTIPVNNATTVLLRDSLPPSARKLYTNNSGVAVAAFSRGSGTLFFLGWDWYDAAPAGSQDQGWLSILQSALIPNCSNCPPRFTIQPTNQTVLPGTNVTLVASAVGTAGPVRYQWRFGGVDVPNATNAAYSFTGASLTNHGFYSVSATDSNGTASSSNALIYVLVRPSILVQPQPRTVLEGQTAIFTIVATGAPPLHYRWIRGGFPYLTSSVPMLVLTNNLSNTTIRVGVTNLASGLAGLNSAIVQLTVLADFDRDGMADSWETQYGFNTNNAADALLDFDGDGMNNRDEYIAGTNPTVPSNLLKLAVSVTNAVMLEFTAQANVAYTVQYQTNLGAAAWSNLMTVPAQPQVRTFQFTATNPPFWQRFYRVVTPPVP